MTPRLHNADVIKSPPGVKLTVSSSAIDQELRDATPAADAAGRLFFFTFLHCKYRYK